MIPFNKPHLTGKEAHYIFKAVYDNGHISGNGEFTKKCQAFFESRYGFRKTLLTTSCTDALEMAALLIDLQPGDEVIMPSYTFVSTANAFILRGAKIVFADSEKNTPNIDADKIEALITPKTKAIIPVHYAGMACDMDKIMSLAKKYNLFVIEDTAQGIESTYNGKQLGGIGHLGAFSFHETKNIQSGEGGLLVVNDERFVKRAEIIWEKGTNRAEFFRGEVDKYGWVDVGSSFLASDMIAAFLLAQLENLEKIQNKRIDIWNTYYDNLSEMEKNGKIQIPKIPEYASNNAHMFYVLCESLEERTKLIAHMKKNAINPVFHYLPLHESEFYKNKNTNNNISEALRYSDTLLRLPLFYDLKQDEQQKIIKTFFEFYNG